MLLIAAAAALLLVGLFRKKKLKWPVLLLLLLLDASGAVLMISEMRAGDREALTEVSVETLEKAETMPLEVQTDTGEAYQVDISAPDPAYTEEETKAFLDEAADLLEQKVIGKNASFERVEWNLDLPASLEDLPVSIQWYTDQPDVLGFDGVIQPEIPPEGTEVLLYAELYVQDQTDTWQQLVTVFPSKESSGVREEIIRKTQRENENTAAKTGIFRLPEEAGGKKLRWFRMREKRGILFSLLALAGGLLIAAGERERSDQRRKERMEQMLQDYPELISKMQLFLGAGLSMRSIFSRLAGEYQRRKKEDGKVRYVYEELCQAVRMMESGKTELEAYEEFGSRCGLPCYRSMALLLEQNLKKGGAGIMPMLEREVQEAFETRKRTARAEGEKATLRLLLPMAMMLAVVMALILLPAFMSF